MEDEILDLNEETPSSLDEKPEADGAKAAAAEGDETQKLLKELRAELAETRKLATEKDKAAQYWAEQATKREQQPAKTEKKAALSPDEFVNEFTVKGADAIREQGFVHASDIPAIVAKQIAEAEAARSQQERKAAAVLSEMGISGDFEMRMEVGRHLEQIAKEYPNIDEMAGLKWAAERAKASMGGNGKQQGEELNERRRQVSGSDRGASRGVMTTPAPTFNSNDNAVFAALKNHGLTEASFKAAKAAGKRDLI